MQQKLHNLRLNSEVVNRAGFAKCRGLCKHLALGLVVVAASQALAENRALLIGVGEYADAGMNLPGIQADVEAMQLVAQRFGFSEGDIRTLLDEDAKLEDVRREFKQWLQASKYGEGDRVLVYFSGHGAHVQDDNGDEEDGRDEILVLHDTRVEGGGLRNFLRDDEFGALLDGIDARNVLVLIDACHSGTATKAIRLVGAAGKAKYFPNPTLPFQSGGTVDLMDKNIVARGRTNHVLLSAAADNELAQATSNGSAFTLGVSETVNSALREGRSLTPKQLQAGVSEHIRSLLDASRRHTPQLSGGEGLLAANLFFAAQRGPGPTRRKLERLAERLEAMPMEAPKAEYRLGQTIAFTVNLPTGGYLNVVNVGPKDDAVVLFPNAFHRDNKVSAGTFRLPTERMAFDLVAQEPLGESVTVAFLSQRSVNLYQDAVKGRDRDGNLVAQLAPLSAKAIVSARSIGVRGRNGGENYAGKALVEVVR